MNQKNPNTDALIEEVLKNFFTDEEAKEFSTKYLQEVQPVSMLTFV